jgi:hypothetical protein
MFSFIQLIYISYHVSGESTYLDKEYTYFGQALSHTIAQFACEKNFHIIMSRVSCGLTLVNFLKLFIS